MNKILYALLCTCFCVPVTRVLAQDPHFSQYFSSPMTMNPAFAGRMVDDWRGGINMRSQWWGQAIKPYYTVTAAVEKKIAMGADNPSYWGLGGMVVSDQSNGGILKNNYFSLTAAYHIALDGRGRHMLGAGLMGTYANRILDANKFLFQSQLGSMGFQRSTPANDGIAIQKNNYFDISAGLYYSYTGEKSGFAAGGALFHAARPKEGTHENTTYNMPRKYSANASYWFKTGVANEMHLSGFAEFQGGNSIYTLGGVYKIGIADELLRSVNVGVFKRFGDAWYPYMALEAQSWLAGFTYDFVRSDVGKYASVQSMELSFVWKMGSKNTGRQAGTGIVAY
ncbi:type IX secretion system PorP/SprF family membrane protein [Filimonas zeae]|nr:PorP/SprF family type IX secretion system membrane protein [Filimonas zeae]MDR6338759.1 type IX secretion system PorP/SprF family membrane protein [Filimonas zeae]